MDEDFPTFNLELNADDAGLLLYVLQKTLKAGVLDEDIEGWVCDFNDPLKEWVIKTAKEMCLSTIAWEE